LLNTYHIGQICQTHFKYGIILVCPRVNGGLITITTTE